MIGVTYESIDAWRTGMHSYQKQKRTKKPFGRQYPTNPLVTQSQMKQKQTRYNPILQNFREKSEQEKYNQREQALRKSSLIKHYNSNKKYQKDYDIINLHTYDGLQASQTISPKKLKEPIRNLYNPINNTKFPDFYFNNRDMKVPRQPEFKVLSKNDREFDIISCGYRNNNQEKFQKQMQQLDKEVLERSRKLRVYDTIGGRYFNEEKQKQYQQELEKQQIAHRQKSLEKLPPSYVIRQPLIFDHTKPVPSHLQQYDEKKKNAKKRYQLRYLVEDEYQKRNQQNEEKKQSIIRNKVHNGKLLEHMSKQFDIINSQIYPKDRTEKLFNKKASQSTWEQLNSHYQIKSSGFGIN